MVHTYVQEPYATRASCIDLPRESSCFLDKQLAMTHALSSAEAVARSETRHGISRDLVVVMSAAQHLGTYSLSELCRPECSPVLLPLAGTESSEPRVLADVRCYELGYDEAMSVELFELGVQIGSVEYPLWKARWLLA